MLFLSSVNKHLSTFFLDAYVTGFAGAKVKSQLKDGLVFGVGNIGAGSVIFLADDPLFRHFWESGKMLFANAVFLVGQ